MAMSRRARSRLSLPLAAALLAGCGTSAPASEPAASSAPSPPGASIGASPASSSAVTHRFTFGDAIVVDTEITKTNDLYINPGAVIESNGVLHMYPNSFSTWPGKVRVPHLTSTDGVAWTLDEASGLAIDGAEVAQAEPGIDISSGFIADDGTWVLVFETVTTSSPWRLFRATAPGPEGPWTVDAEPILTPGAAGYFDAGGIHWPSVVKAGDRWALYYAGFDTPQGGSGSIGLAWSEDGATWQKQAEPVLVASERWEGRSMDRPRLASTPEGLVMVYAGRDLTDRGIATSSDGIEWTKLPGPNIEQGDFPLRARAWDAALHYADGELQYWLEIGFETTAIYRATLAWP